MTRSEFLQHFHHLRQVRQEPDYPLRKAGKRAAVLIPLLESSAGLSVILTQRASHLRSHPGQISFPGGAAEPEDDNAADTALREAEEEIGLPRSHVEVLGRLPDYRTISGFVIRPIIGFVKPGFSYRVDRDEVEQVFNPPLAFLMNKANHHTYHFERKGKQFPLYFIQYEQHLIWGATAAILRNLSHHLDLTGYMDNE